MKSTARSPRVLTAADVMNRTVVTVPHRMPLGTVARTFARCNTNILPVVDGQGEFIGAIAMAELFRWASEGGHYDTPGCIDWRTMASGAGRTDEVRWYLMKDPPVVAPGTGIPELAELLRKSRVVLVIDKQRRPVGTILAVDVLAVTDPFETQPPKKLEPHLTESQQAD
jgi:CBS domain-containing protein